MPEVVLKPGKDRPVRFGHPWIFSGAISSAPAVEPGEVVRVRAADGALLGSGYFNPNTAIAVRMLARGEEVVDAAWMRGRVRAACALRDVAVPRDTTAFRLINGEGDGLPGFAVDRYDAVLVLQCLTAGAERLKPLLVDALLELVAPAAIYERSDGTVRRAEGLAAASGVLWGSMPDAIVGREHGIEFAVDPAGGQKTGFFLDQRDNRALLRSLAAGRRVLDAFCYTGGFALAALAGGAAHVTAVDASRRALELADHNRRHNRFEESRLELVAADVPSFLRRCEADFDVVVLDPPALVKQRRDVERGARAYKDLHLSVLKRARPGTVVLSFSCSQHVGPELFRKIVTGAAADAARDVQVLRRLGPGADHPVALGHAEGEYLCGLLLRVAG